MDASRMKCMIRLEWLISNEMQYSVQATYIQLKIWPNVITAIQEATS